MRGSTARSSRRSAPVQSRHARRRQRGERRSAAPARASTPARQPSAGSSAGRAAVRPLDPRVLGDRSGLCRLTVRPRPSRRSTPPTPARLWRGPRRAEVRARRGSRRAARRDDALRLRGAVTEPERLARAAGKGRRDGFERGPEPQRSLRSKVGMTLRRSGTYVLHEHSVEPLPLGKVARSYCERWPPNRRFHHGASAPSAPATHFPAVVSNLVEDGADNSGASRGARVPGVDPRLRPARMRALAARAAARDDATTTRLTCSARSWTPDLDRVRRSAVPRRPDGDRLRPATRSASTGLSCTGRTRTVPTSARATCAARPSACPHAPGLGSRMLLTCSSRAPRRRTAKRSPPSSGTPPTRRWPQP